ncbi:MAG: glycosyltransferase family 2 protein [Chitinispirillaceae bacterium]|nr:glycosyltransferase family 2 protein [Chitinispirillaceae bacterium]
MPSTEKKISIIVPCYNEEENVRTVYDEITRVVSTELSGYNLELLFVDDHSSDRTFTLLKEIAQKDPRVIVLRLSRNFGHQRAIFTGMKQATGSAAVQLDCDLQDPPSLLPAFIRKWEEGFHVVYGIRQRREESWLMQRLRHAGYGIINLLSEASLPPDAGDFRLIDRTIIDALRRLDDDQFYLRGAIAAMGFRQTGIPYDRPARHAGKSKYSLWKLLKLAVNGILDHSVIPLRAAIWTGLFVSFGSMVLLIVYLVSWRLGIGNWPRGFATTTLLILFSIGLNSVFLGILGEYLGRIYRVLKKTSRIHIEERVSGGRSATEH